MIAEKTEPQLPENLLAWRFDTYSAWINRYGLPADAAAKIRDNPTKSLKAILSYLGIPTGKRIINLMGSSGVKAVALSVLDADVTIVDISPSNARYARELADAAGVTIRYVISDVLSLADNKSEVGSFDIAFAELGIVHYFTDLHPLMHVVSQILRPSGRFILRDFHPVSTKLIKFRGSTAKVRKYKVDGDYFDDTLERKPVSFSKHIPASENREVPTVIWRKWTLGEIVTAVASSGMRIMALSEEPNLSSDVFDAGIPKTFTLVAEAMPHCSK